jgi:hypothetical protein
MLRGMEDLLSDRPLDVRPVVVRERLQASGSLPDLQGVDLDRGDHGRPARIGDIDRDIPGPPGDLDRQVMAGLAAQPGAAGLDP